ncbi:Glycerol kinase [Phytophthora nicotianae]|uniref:Glycerol kinase n=1 Tax=Phytophthora nicotianae TaxID=4792 RepID=A0A0W8CXJ6_PHYNI|nr:Glycerol kinase [Phytophthora nicotianae]
MVHRYFAVLELMGLLSSPACNRRLKELYADLKDFESVSKALQGENMSLLDVRVWFDGLIEAQPAFAAYITPRANIVHSPDFESGCVRVLKGNGARLTASEKRALRSFLQVDRAPNNNDEEAETDSLVQRLEKRRRLKAREARYCLVGSIPATSNKVERFFSVARATLGHERNGLQLISLEMVLFLRENSRFWDVSTVDQLL